MDGFTGFKTATTEELPDAVAVMDPVLCRGPGYADVVRVGGGGRVGGVGIITGCGGRRGGCLSLIHI